MNIKLFTLLSFASLCSCSSEPPAPTSLCDLPPNLAGWTGTKIHWSGYIVDASPHGLYYIDNNCSLDRGAKISYFGKLAESEFEEFQRNAESSRMRVEFIGKITGKELLIDQFIQMREASFEEVYPEAKK